MRVKLALKMADQSGAAIFLFYSHKQLLISPGIKNINQKVIPFVDIVYHVFRKVKAVFKIAVFIGIPFFAAYILIYLINLSSGNI